MTIPMDCTISYTAGNVFAIASKEAIKSEPEIAERNLRRGRLFTFFITLPIGIYFLVRWPDWSWAYSVGARSRSAVLGTLGLAGYLASHEIGYRYAARSIRAGRDGRAFASAMASFASFFLIVVLGWQRFRYQGTREEFESGVARDVLKSPDFIVALGLAMIVFFLGAVVVSYLNWRDST